jgi:DNA invertase Pin-like site-specific DNA recombinase
MGKFLLTVFAGLSELERNIINERTNDGRMSAQKRGVKFGRKFKLTTHQQDQVKAMLREGQAMRSIARHFNVGVATIDRIKKAMPPI